MQGIRWVVLGVVVALGAACSGGSSPDPVELVRDEPSRGTVASTSSTSEPATSSTGGSVTPADTGDTAPSPPPGFPRAADDPAGLAAQLAEAEAAIHDSDVVGDELRGHAWVQQAAYRRIAATPEWLEPVLARVPERLRGVVDSNASAAIELRGMHGRLATKLPAWEIVDPAPAEELLGHYRAAAAEFGIEWEYLAAINLIETRMGRIRGVSVAGAQGPMQFMPPTWEAYGEGDVHDDGDAIRAAARYLRANGAPEDMFGAIWNYNHHNNYVRAVLHYARVLQAHGERAYLAYHHWQVMYRSEAGDVWLCTGYRQPEPIPATNPAPDCG